MRAVVLVGGVGSRLRPLTHSVPKPMLPIGHEPMIASLIKRLERGGVTRVVLALGFKPEPFIEAFPDGHCGEVELTYAVEPEPLDTAGAIRFAAEFAEIEETFVVANGDVMTDLDVAELVRAHRRLGAEATIHLIGVDDPSSFGVVDMDNSCGIQAFIEKPAAGDEPSNLVNAGTYVFEPSVIDRIPPGRRVSIERDIFPMIAADGLMFGFPTDDYWIDAGRPEFYRAANLDLLNGSRRHDRCDPISAAAAVDNSATIENSVVGAGASVEAGASVVDSVLLPGARIGRHARVSSSLVMGEVVPHASVSNSMVGADGAIATSAGG